MNLIEVKKARKDGEANGILYITGQRNSYPAGLYLVTAVLDDNEDLIFVEFNTGYQIERPDGTTFELHGHNLTCTGQNIESGEEFNNMQVTASDEIIDAMDKNPKASILVQTVERKRSRGEGTYQVLELRKIGEKKELEEHAEDLLGKTKLQVN